MSETGHKFTYRHSGNEYGNSVECHEDIAMPALVEAFIDYCLGCGFSRQTIEKNIGPQSHPLP